MADSKFCRDCGAELVATQTSVLQDENRKMVSDAQKLFGQGRYDEAALVATAVLENDPDCIEALALRGDCHERIGEYSLALECYRHILKIQPESQLDRIRVARLEKMLDSEQVEVGAPTTRRRTAIGAAIAAAVLLVSSGSALIIASQQPDNDFANSDEPVSSGTPFYPPVRIPSGNSNYSPNDQPAPEDPDLAGIGSSESRDGSIQPIITTEIPGDFSRSTLPWIGSDQIDPNGPDRTLPIGASGGGLTGVPNGANGGGVQDPDPEVVNSDGDEDSGMIVDVRGREFTDPNSGSTTVGDTNAVKTLIRVAREHFIVGEYAKAAGAWEQALRRGASPASTNQRLAQCYARLGNKAKAISAYEKAIVAFEKLDQDDSLVRASLDSCRQALKLLRSE